MTIDELIKAANEYRKRYDITYSEGVILPLSSIMADFAAECVKDALALADAADNYCDRCGDIVQVNAIERAIRAERERADRLKRECDNIYERLSWILSACTIDRDAKNEIEELLK